MTEITAENYQSRHPKDYVDRFRSALRVNIYGLPEERRDELMETMLPRLAQSIVSSADMQGWTVEVEKIPPEVWIKDFDYGNRRGVAGGVTVRFTASLEQMNRWLLHELEARDLGIAERGEQLQRLRGWWLYRLWHWPGRVWATVRDRWRGDRDADDD